MKKKNARFMLIPIGFLTGCVLLMIPACNQGGEGDRSATTEMPSTDSIVAYNKEMVMAELLEIDDFTARYRWEMATTPTGLRYMIYHKGAGRAVQPGDSITVNYRISLLTGETVYISDTMRPFTFVPGKRSMVSGFEEGIMLMRTGDHAKLIIPSHLAFGVLGDLSRIPSRATLVCDVELCSVKPLKK